MADTNKQIQELQAEVSRLGKEREAACRDRDAALIQAKAAHEHLVEAERENGFLRAKLQKVGPKQTLDVPDGAVQLDEGWTLVTGTGEMVDAKPGDVLMPMGDGSPEAGKRDAKHLAARLGPGHRVFSVRAEDIEEARAKGFVRA